MSKGAATAERPLAEAAWLKAPDVAAVFAALAAPGAETRVVGGAVRDALMGRSVGEVDFATTLLPGEVEALAEAAGHRVVRTGFEHGTVTMVVRGKGFEVTTLREDVATDGRHAVVRFGRSWEADARRRDFTVNALTADADGRVFDPVGGAADISTRHVRFIGDPDRRIAEDRLRVLRFFRFHAQFGEGRLDKAGLAASIRARNDLRALSAERVGQEMRRLIVAAGAADAAEAMQEAGILPAVLGGIAYIAALRRLADFEREARRPPVPAIRLAALACRVAEDAERVAQRLRLSNRERDAMLGAIAGAPLVAKPAEPGRGSLVIAYRLGKEGLADAVALAAAWGEGPLAPWLDVARWATTVALPRFPLRGEDVAEAGVPHGPEIGRALRNLEQWWIDGGFAGDREALLARLKQIVAGRP